MKKTFHLAHFIEEVDLFFLGGPYPHHKKPSKTNGFKPLGGLVDYVFTFTSQIYSGTLARTVRQS